MSGAPSILRITVPADVPTVRVAVPAPVSAVRVSVPSGQGPKGDDGGEIDPGDLTAIFDSQLA